MYRKCGNCVHWIPLLYKGQCRLDSHYCEHYMICDKYKCGGYVEVSCIEERKNK